MTSITKLKKQWMKDPKVVEAMNDPKVVEAFEKMRQEFTKDRTHMTINKPIETDAEYRAALKRIEELLDLMELIEAYEAKHFPLLEDDNQQQEYK